MITFQKLGDHGQLGNQMFQYAMLEGAKARLNCDIVFSEGKENIDIFRCFKISDIHFFNPHHINLNNKFVEDHFDFNRKIIYVNDDTNFEGYFQSEKYFKHCKERIQNQFTFKDDIVSAATNYISQYSDKTLISIHVRRGDYLNYPNHHPTLTMDYYNRAFTYFQDIPNPLFIVSSDDKEWCRQNFTQDNVIISDNNHHVDMCITSLCHHNIIANSSFSWWGAWLNKNENKIIVSPKTWFGPAYFHYDTKDLY